MCCGPAYPSEHHAASAVECCCCTAGLGAFQRRYRTARERRERLEAYRDELKAELAGVDERMQELEKK